MTDLVCREHPDQPVTQRGTCPLCPRRKTRSQRRTARVQRDEARTRREL